MLRKLYERNDRAQVIKPHDLPVEVPVRRASGRVPVCLGYYEFEDDPTLFIADIHEDGRFLYPGTGMESETGLGDAKDTKLNIPLKPGSDDNDFIAAFKKVQEFIDNVAQPELIILQCGADCINGDPLTHLKYTSKAHRYAADMLHLLSHKHCDGKMIALGGGGYNKQNIGDAWTEVVGSLINNNMSTA